MTTQHTLSAFQTFLSKFGEEKGVGMLKTLVRLEGENQNDKITFFHDRLASMIGCKSSDLALCGALRFIRYRGVLYYILNKHLGISYRSIAMHYAITHTRVMYSANTFEEIMTAMDNKFIYEQHKEIITLCQKMIALIEAVN